MKSRNKLIRQYLLFLIFFSVSTIVGFFLVNKNLVNSPISVSKTESIFPTPTPGPFNDLTVPYLREKKYESKLGELGENFVGDKYTSFLTSYKSDELLINGLITKPNGEMPEGGWPAIVFVHGYIPPKQYKTTQQYSAYVDYLANNGFVVFKIDLRGHDQSQGEPGGAYYSSDYIIDTLNAYKALQSSGFVNPKKIGLWGHSMAGNVVMRSTTAMPEIPATVIWAGAVYSYVDFTEFGIQDGSYQPPTDPKRASRRQKLFAAYGPPNKNSDFWRQVAPTTYLKDLKGSIQIHHAVDDNVVNIEYSRNLNGLLSSSSVSHELNEYPNGGHNISGESFNQAMEKTVEFFNKYLVEG